MLKRIGHWNEPDRVRIQAQDLLPNKFGWLLTQSLLTIFCYNFLFSKMEIILASTLITKLHLTLPEFLPQ